MDVTLPSGPAVWLGPTNRLRLGGSTSNVMGSPGRKPPAVSVNGVPAGPRGGDTARVPALVGDEPPKMRRRRRPHPGVKTRAATSTVAVSRVLHGKAGRLGDMGGPGEDRPGATRRRPGAGEDRRPHW